MRRGGNRAAYIYGRIHTHLAAKEKIPFLPLKSRLCLSPLSFLRTFSNKFLVRDFVFLPNKTNEWRKELQVCGKGRKKSSNMSFSSSNARKPRTSLSRCWQSRSSFFSHNTKMRALYVPGVCEEEATRTTEKQRERWRIVCLSHLIIVHAAELLLNCEFIGSESGWEERAEECGWRHGEIECECSTRQEMWEGNARHTQHI